MDARNKYKEKVGQVYSIDESIRLEVLDNIAFFCGKDIKPFSPKFGKLDDYKNVHYDFKIYYRECLIRKNDVMLSLYDNEDNRLSCLLSYVVLKDIANGNISNGNER